MRILLISSLFSFLSGIAQTTFQRTYGTAMMEMPKQVVSTSDKGFVTVGTEGNVSPVFIVKTDSLGVIQWTKRYGPFEYVTSIAQTSDGGYVLSGKTSTYQYPGGATILRIDANGNYVSSVSYNQFTYIFGIMPTFDGGLIALSDAPYFGITLFKTDMSGTVQWSKVFDPPNFVYAMHAIQLKYDSGFVAVCRHHTGGTTIRMVLSKFDKNGNFLWHKTTEGPSGVYKLIEGRNGNVLVAASGMIYEADKNGNSVKTINCPGTINDIALSGLSDKGYIITGYSSMSPGPYKAFVARLDSSFNPIWAKKIGGANEDLGNSVTRALNGGFVMAGMTKSFSIGDFDCYFVKIDSMGNSSCNTNTMTLTVSQSVKTTTVITFNNVNLVNLMSQPAAFSLNASSTYTSHNACGCITPVADFSSGGTCMNDQSTWAANWYWTFSDGSTSSNINACFTPTAQSGTITACLKVTNACGQDSVCKTFTYQVLPVLVSEVMSNEAAKVYPNPFSETLTLATDALPPSMPVKVYNALGMLVYSFELTEKEKEINLRHLSPGIYFLRINTGSSEITKKIIKQ